MQKRMVDCVSKKVSCGKKNCYVHGAKLRFWHEGGVCASRGAAAGCTGFVELFYATHIAMRWFCSKHPKKGHFENHRWTRRSSVSPSRSCLLTWRASTSTSLISVVIFISCLKLSPVSSTTWSSTDCTCGFPTAHYVIFRWDTFLHDAMYNLHYALQLFPSLIHAFCNMLMAPNSNLTVIFFYITVCEMHITYSSDETNFCMMQCIICNTSCVICMMLC